MRSKISGGPVFLAPKEMNLQALGIGIFLQHALPFDARSAYRRIVFVLELVQSPFAATFRAFSLFSSGRAVVVQYRLGYFLVRHFLELKVGLVNVVQFSLLPRIVVG